MNILERILLTYEKNRMPIKYFGVSFEAHINRRTKTRSLEKYRIYAELIGELESTVIQVAKYKARPTARILDDIGAEIEIEEFIVKKHD